MTVRLPAARLHAGTAGRRLRMAAARTAAPSCGFGTVTRRPSGSSRPPSPQGSTSSSPVARRLARRPCSTRYGSDPAAKAPPRRLLISWGHAGSDRVAAPSRLPSPQPRTAPASLTSSGPALQRTDLTAEAVRLTRLLDRLLPGEGEVAGLLALMLLTDARRAARTDPDGRIVPLAGQRRQLWDTAAITEGQALLTRTLGTGPVGPYQLQAAIAALHDEAPTAEDTDWPQILALYDILATVAPGPLVTLSRAVALAMVHGPKPGLALLGTLDTDDRMTHTHRLEAVRAHLLERAGDTATAHESYLRAAKMTASLPEQRYLALRAAQLRHPAPPADPAS